ncbi:MAG TPA: hypothetical protein VGM90_21090 [Kofleriaceae bacterium]|jgi:hypothetical protein
MRRLLPLLVLAALPRIAHAECRYPSAVGPLQSTVPSHATIFVYLDQAQDYRSTAEVPVFITWIEGRGSAKITQVSPSIARVDVQGSDRAVFTVRESTYHIDAKLSVDRAPSIDALERDRGRWKCSSWDLLGIELSDAQNVAAIRADWTFHGERRTFWSVPHSYGDRHQDNDALADVTFGKIDCGSTTIPPEELAAGGMLALTAVLVDGSTRVLTNGTTISDDTVPVNRRAVLPTSAEIDSDLAAARAELADDAVQQIARDAAAAAAHARRLRIGAALLLLLASLFTRVASGVVRVISPMRLEDQA